MNPLTAKYEGYRYGQSVLHAAQVPLVYDAQHNMRSWNDGPQRSVRGIRSGE